MREWIKDWLNEYGGERTVAEYSLEHLDTTSNVSQRENGKQRLASATES